MAEIRQSQGTFRLFRAFGIDVSLHWTWLLLAIYVWQVRPSHYQAKGWAAAEYLALFVIVLLHEFGHALACRSVGGKADRILLWPFGGVAFVSPPQRPGALLWSIAAGPLVNIVLVPVTLLLAELVRPDAGDVHMFVTTLFYVNIALLVFNLLPIYPLDGGQMLRALLWFAVGQGRSLMVAAMIGLVGAGGVLVLALYVGSVWLVMLAVLGAMQSWNGYQQARFLLEHSLAPVPGVVRCPACGAAASSICVCSCGCRYDSRVHGDVCPDCGRAEETAVCPHCGQQSPISAWHSPPGFPVMPTHPPRPPVGPYVPPSAEGFDR